MLRRCKEVGSVVRFLKRCGKLTSSWPCDPGASFQERLREELLWLVSFLNVLGLLMPLMLAAYHHRIEINALMKSLTEFTALSEVFFNLIICKIQRNRLQSLLREITNYVDNAGGKERLVLQKYSDRYLPFSITVGTSSIIAAVLFSCGPIILPTPLPGDAFYPFPIESIITKCTLYVLEVLAILQVGLCIAVDFMVSMIFWFLAARLEILGLKMKSVTNVTELNMWIAEHQKLIACARETNNAVRFIIFKCVITMAIIVICSGFLLIHKENFFVLSKFFLTAFLGSLRIYGTAWPADDLSEMSESVGLSLYCSNWFDGSLEMKKSVVLVIQRSQKPLVISVAGVLTALTLKFYAAVASSTLSYFMTLRVIFGE